MEVFTYPKEHLDPDVFILPIKMRKSELAIFLDKEWELIRREIYTNKALYEKLVDARYKLNSKVLSPAQVAILFSAYKPPLTTPENLILYRNIKKRNFLELAHELAVLGILVAA